MCVSIDKGGTILICIEMAPLPTLNSYCLLRTTLLTLEPLPKYAVYSRSKQSQCMHPLTLNILTATCPLPTAHCPLPIATAHSH